MSGVYIEDWEVMLLMEHFDLHAVEFHSQCASNKNRSCIKVIMPRRANGQLGDPLKLGEDDKVIFLRRIGCHYRLVIIENKMIMPVCELPRKVREYLGFNGPRGSLVVEDDSTEHRAEAAEVDDNSHRGDTEELFVTEDNVFEEVAESCFLDTTNREASVNELPVKEGGGAELAAAAGAVASPAKEVGGAAVAVGAAADPEVVTTPGKMKKKRTGEAAAGAAVAVEAAADPEVVTTPGKMKNLSTPEQKNELFSKQGLSQNK